MRDTGCDFTFTLTVYEFHLLLRELTFAMHLRGIHDPEPARMLYQKLGAQANGQNGGGKP